MGKSSDKYLLSTWSASLLGVRPEVIRLYLASVLAISGIAVFCPLVDKVSVVSSVTYLTSGRSIDVVEAHGDRDTPSTTALRHSSTKPTDKIATWYVSVPIRLLVERRKGCPNILLVDLCSLKERLSESLF